jgi:hypothetical protein
MTKVRQGIFETNSSSSHSLSIGNLEAGDDIVDSDNCETIILGTGEFGWEWEDYDSWLDKADYLSILMVQYSNGHIDNLLNAIRRKYPNVEITISDSGYIDHGCDYWEDWMDDEDQIFIFLFGNGGISTGNDNEEMLEQKY